MGALDPDLLSGENLTDPYPVLAELRERSPVTWSERYGGWMITGYDVCAAAHHDERISSDRIEPVLRKLEAAGGDERLAATLRVLAGWMVFKDGGEHRRLRLLMQRSFTPRTVARMHERVGQIADALLDLMFRAPVAGTGDLRTTSHPVAGTGDLRTTSHSVDLVSRFAAPLPAAVIADMCGAPTADHDRFRRWSEDIVSLVFGATGEEDRHERAIAGMADLVAYLDELIAARREASSSKVDPRDDLVSLTLREDADGDRLSDDEVVAMCTLLLFGGSETTTNLIGSGLLALMRHPDQRAWLLEDPAGRAGPAIEELLRYDGPARVSVRIVGSDLELGGHTLKAGQRVFLVIAAANRDPAQFPHPNTLDLAREPNQHLGFGVGKHYCLGASLARLEGSVVIPRVLQRLGDIELETDDLRYNPMLLSRSLRELPVRLPARAA